MYVFFKMVSFACCELENLGTSRLEALIKEMLLFSNKIQCPLSPSLYNASLLGCKAVSLPLYDATICPVQPAVVDEKMLSRSDEKIGVGKVKGRPANAHKQTHEMSFLIPRLDSRRNRIVISSPFTRQCYNYPWPLSSPKRINTCS